MKIKPNNYRELLTVKEVAEILRIPVNTVYYLVRKGELCGLRIGKHIRFSSQRIQQYINESQKSAQNSLAYQNTTSQERRKYPRINSRIPCRISHGFEIVSHDAMVVNISTHGALINFNQINNQLYEDYHCDDPVQLRLHIDALIASEQKMIDARVVRHCSKNVSSLAIVFRNLNEELKNWLKIYIG